MLRGLFLAVLVVAATAISGCRSRAPSSPVHGHEDRHGLVIHEWVHATSLEHNKLADSPERSVHVYLPPSYFEPPRRSYPVVYLLHGFGATSGADVSWLVPNPSGPTLAVAMDEDVARGTVGEMIVVMPDATNAYGGSFYVNSPVTGRWEDFIVRELVAFVDARFRTIPEPGGRAIVGHSMGGFGALRIAFAHPEVFSVLYALSPCCIDDMLVRQTKPHTFLSALGAGDADTLARRPFFERAAIAAGAAFTPNPVVAPFPVDLPFVSTPAGDTRVERVERVWATMLASSSVSERRATIARLRAIGLDVGVRDEVRAILPTTRAMDRALSAAGLAHRYEEFEGGHDDRLGERIARVALPFASAGVIPARGTDGPDVGPER